MNSTVDLLMLPGEFEEYQLQREFFIDMIGLAPKAAQLHITSDSWDGLPSLLGTRMMERDGEWIVPLRQENKDFLVQQAQADNLQSKFVHFFLLHEGTEIVASYDGMCTVLVDESFPSYPLLRKKHAAFLNLME
ncbi:hypothetical protein [Hymenobacter metallicola]|nr:hypothetical protein [Hymenobacter metallicola]